MFEGRRAKRVSVYINQVRTVVPIQQTEIFGTLTLMAYEAA